MIKLPLECVLRRRRFVRRSWESVILEVINVVTEKRSEVVDLIAA